MASRFARRGVHLVKLLFGFQGRINRGQFWLGNTLAGMGGVMLVYAVGYGFGAAKETLALSWLSLPFILVAMTWSSYALQVKRFHDRGRSGYWVLAPLAPASMIVGAVLAGIGDNIKPALMLPELMLWFAILGVINLWFLVDLGMLPGVDGPNKYGPPPGAGSVAVAASTPENSQLRNAARAIDRAIGDQPSAPPAPRSAPAAYAPAPLAPSPVAFGRKPAT
ncbi:MAG: DUF805 domain-containing protein [Hyphomonadaceae bacterium]|nr:DUF805 domain-containing protein [Hyphomonadaceae bacterium]